MKARDKKLALLHLLSEEAAALSFNELVNKLDYDYAERTVRRWLNEMVREGLVKKTGQKRGTKYQVVQTEAGKRGAASSCFGTGSLQALAYIRRPIYDREPTAYQEKWFDLYEPNVTFYLSAEVRDRLHRAGERATNNDPAGTYAHQIFDRLLIDLSYNSSRLEGNTYTLLDTEKLVLKGTSAEGKLNEERVMILNHKEAIRYLVDNAPKLRIDFQTICTLHYLLSDGLVESKLAGKVRDHWVRISGSTYIPYESSKQIKLQLEKVLEKAGKILDPFEQSLFLLVHLSYLQPFSDVNKRCARLSANIPLVVNNLVPLSFNDVERGDYMSATISVYEIQDINPIVDLYVFSYLRTCAAYDSTVKAIGFDEIRVRYRAIRRAIIREVIEQNLSGVTLENYVDSETEKLIPASDQKEFLDDLFEDLDQMDESRIAGLGVTPEQVRIWKAEYIKGRQRS